MLNFGDVNVELRPPQSSASRKGPVAIKYRRSPTLLIPSPLTQTRAALVRDYSAKRGEGDKPRSL